MSDDGVGSDAASWEARLTRLEAREQALREFIVPAYWDLLDRLEARTPPETSAACLACGVTHPLSAFARRIDTCVFGGGRLERLQCPECGCVFGPLKYLRAPETLVAADYRLLYTDYAEGDSTEAEIRAFEMLQPRPGELYLNWGCGAWSRSVEILRARGHDVWGYEPNAAVDRPFIVRSRGEISARFHGIFSNNVIEHMLMPAEEFRDLHGILTPGGRMVHASPCYAWSFAFTRFHVFFPLGAAAAALAARTGFRLAESVDDGDFQARLFLRDAMAAEPDVGPI